MTAAFVALPSLFFLPLSALPGQDAPAQTALEEYARGVFAELDGAPASARLHFETALERDLHSFVLAQKAASLQEQTGDQPAATRTLRQYAENHPLQLDPQLYFADFLKRQVSTDEAARNSMMDILSKANLRFPNHPEVYTRLIHLHENLGQRNQSLEVLRDQLTVTSAGAEHWIALEPLVKTLLPGGSKQLENALHLIIEKIIETGLHLPLAARRASDHYQKNGQLAEAIDILEKHVEIQPDSLGLRIRAGLLQLYNRDEDAALRTLHTTLQIDSDQPLAHKALAQFYSRKGQLGPSLHHQAEVLRITGGAPTDFLQLAKQFLDSGNSRKARLTLEKAHFDYPDNPSIVAQLAIATLREGDFTKASRLFRQTENLVDSLPGAKKASVLGPTFQIEFATALMQVGDSTGAETRLRDAIRRIAPERPGHTALALRKLARVWIEQNRNLAPAASLLNRAKALDPEHPETAELLQRIQQKSQGHISR